MARLLIDLRGAQHSEAPGTRPLALDLADALARAGAPLDIVVDPALPLPVSLPPVLRQPERHVLATGRSATGGRSAESFDMVVVIPLEDDGVHGYAAAEPLMLACDRVIAVVGPLPSRPRGCQFAGRALLQQADLVVALSADAFATASEWPARDVAGRAHVIALDELDETAGSESARRERFAERFLDLWKRTAAQNDRRPSSRPVARVAFVGPLPPTESGVAVYNERVIASLEREDVELHLFIEGEGDPERCRSRVERAYPIEALDRQVDAGEYDVVVYTVGNSRFHVRTLELARRIPGVVWLHDAFVGGLYIEWAAWSVRTGRRSGDAVSVLREELTAMYGNDVDVERLFSEPFSHRNFLDQGLLLASQLAGDARALVVNSAQALDMVRADLRGRPSPPTSVIPHAFPPVLRAERSSRHEPPLIVALGVVHAIKRPDVLLEAVSLLRPDVRLAFVGPCDPETRLLVETAGARLGLANRFTVTGHVDQRAYRVWLQEADVAVQLRDVSFGEASGTVHDALAAGVPTITSVSSARELPPGCVELVAPDVTAQELAARIDAIVNDPDRWSAMRRVAWERAATWQFRDVAAALLEAIEVSITDPQYLSRKTGPVRR